MSSLLYFCVFIPRQLGSSLPIAVQWLLSLIFPCAFSLSIDQVIFYLQDLLKFYFSNEFTLIYL